MRRGWSTPGHANWKPSRSVRRALASTSRNWMPTSTFPDSSKVFSARSDGWHRGSAKPEASPEARPSAPPPKRTANWAAGRKRCEVDVNLARARPYDLFTELPWKGEQRLEKGYREMASDTEHEQEAAEWCETLIGDSSKTADSSFRSE